MRTLFTAPITPADIMRRELKIKGSFAQIDCFPRALAYLERKKVKVDESSPMKCRCETIKKRWIWPGRGRESRSQSFHDAVGQTSNQTGDTFNAVVFIFSFVEASRQALKQILVEQTRDRQTAKNRSHRRAPTP
ncbi:MAG: hypothetical protein WB586_21840 [Chthoniobacterales bacterium]